MNRHRIEGIGLGWAARRLHLRLNMERLRLHALTRPKGEAGRIRVHGLLIHYTDAASCYMEYKDIFYHGIYWFAARTQTPFIIDGGGCIGMSVLYHKRLAPGARILCFEPDRDLFAVLQENIRNNRLEGITPIPEGLSGREGQAGFVPDGADGGRVVLSEARGTVPLVRLSPYVDGPVDFLKLNIEGQELEVLEDLEDSGKLQQIRECVIEYHDWPEEEQRLDKLLALLHRNGFRYLLHDFDAKSNPVCKPPFRLSKGRPWFCLVYGRRP